MSVLNYLLSGGSLKKAKKLAAAARIETGDKADSLFQEAYENFASVSSSRAQYPDALHCWGLALLNQAQKKTGEACVKILDEAIVKFNLCDAVKPNHLGASLDGGVALMALAKAKGLSADDELYNKAKELFLVAETIQQGSASYNLACLNAIQGNIDACKEALERARDCGLTPDEQDILNDTDLDNIKQATWFAEFIASLADEESKPEPESEPVKEKDEPEMEDTKTEDSDKKAEE